jgi:hypothetical protein
MRGYDEWDSGPPTAAERLRSWFLEPPYPGAWTAAALALAVTGAALMAAGARNEAPAEVTVVSRPPTRSTSQPAPPKGSPEAQQRVAAERAEITIRSLPPKSVPPAAQPEPQPGVTLEQPAASVPPSSSPAPEQQAQVEPPLPPAPEPEVFRPPAEPEPPRMEAPRVEAPRAEPAEPARPRRPADLIIVPARRTGRVTVYFDADSSTFDDAGQRLPLRVEVYVNGELRLETDDPEKRNFDLGRLPEGRHEIRIVPFVGNAPGRPYRQTVRVHGEERNRFKAVMQRSQGSSRISKFEPRD